MGKKAKIDRKVSTRNVWLRKQKGIKVYNPDRNDGIIVFKFYVSFTGKEKVALIKFMDIDGDLCWQPTIKDETITVIENGAPKKKKVRRKRYDIVSIDPGGVQTLADTLYEVMGMPAKTKEERIKDISARGTLESMADAFDNL